MSIDLVVYIIYIIIAAVLLWYAIHLYHIRKKLQPKCDKAIIAEKTIAQLPYKTSFMPKKKGEEGSKIRGKFMILKSLFKYHDTKYEITSFANQSALVEARQKIENNNAMKSNFVANMSNEIRTPLNAIVGYSQLIIDEEDPDMVKEYATVLDKRAHELLNTINDVLTLTTLQSSSDANRNKVDTCRFLTEMRVYALSLIQKTNKTIDVVIDHPYKEAAYYEDRDRMVQVAKNFISNAVKFSEKGVIRIGMIHVEKNQAVFYVADEGIGIDEDDISTLFHDTEPSRLEKSTRGLGLSICREIITHAHGQYGAVNRPTGGSIFWAYTPLRFTYSSPDASADWDAINTILDLLPIKLSD